MTGSRHRPPGAAGAGALLVLVGLASWALYAKSSGDEAHAYSGAGPAPAYVQVVAGHTYRIAIRGGVAEEIALGVDPASLACTAARPDQTPEALHMTYERRDTKATNDIGSFVATITDRVHVACTGLDAAFVDNAADAPYDWSGVWLVLASLCLLVGAPLVLSALRAAGRGRADSETPEVDAVDPTLEEVL